MELAISIIIVFIISIPLGILWVNGIDYMDKNYPDYKGEDLFNDGIANKLPVTTVCVSHTISRVG